MRDTYTCTHAGTQKTRSRALTIPSSQHTRTEGPTKGTSKSSSHGGNTIPELCISSRLPTTTGSPDPLLLIQLAPPPAAVGSTPPPPQSPSPPPPPPPPGGFPAWSLAGLSTASAWLRASSSELLPKLALQKAMCVFVVWLHVCCVCCVYVYVSHALFLKVFVCELNTVWVHLEKRTWQSCEGHMLAWHLVEPLNRLRDSMHTNESGTKTVITTAHSRVDRSQRKTKGNTHEWAINT